MNDLIQSMVAKSKVAQKEFEKFNQEQVDIIVKEIAKFVYDNAEELARMGYEETAMGVYEDKVKKNQGKASIIWNHLKDKKTVGILSYNEKTGVVEIARPMGVVGAITPCTNPVVTPMANCMAALKCRNSVIISPHPRSKRTAKYLVDSFSKVIAKHGSPENLIQVIEEPTIDLSVELMRQVDVVVATGGMGVVKSAYSSGKPAYGVGAGNVQCIIDQGVDLKEVIPKVVAGRIFDNGIICSGEQTIIVHENDYAEVIKELKINGAHFVDNPTEREKIISALFPNGVMNKNLVGVSADKVAETAGITVPEGTKAIVVEAEGYGTSSLLSKEKMCPIISSYKYKSFQEAVDIAVANLEVEGKGHSVSIHSNNKENIEYAAGIVPVSRVLINQICATMNGGSYFNGFAPTTTLGCGSWGNNSISENFDYKHLMNITRIGYYLKDAKVPTTDELWG